ncbi:MAG: hypothetical protein JWR16_2265 [Nevskia sp.]|nr:hypothetical protein [Nevskia sp.]
MTILRTRTQLFSVSISSVLLSASLAWAGPSNTTEKPASTTANNRSVDDAVVLPPAPTAATPASAMRLPNLPTLGDSDQYAPAASAAPPAAESSAAPPPAPTAAPNSAAAIELQKLKLRTGLSDAQLAALQAAQTRLTSGDEAAALGAAQALSSELDKEAREYIVGDGQNLFSIAGRPEVYANSNLWPLLWWSNLPVLREPWQLRAGMRLNVLAHPSVDQVSTALTYARSHNVLNARLDDRDLPAGVRPH